MMKLSKRIRSDGKVQLGFFSLIDAMFTLDTSLWHCQFFLIPVNRSLAFCQMKGMSFIYTYSTNEIQTS